MCGGSGCNYDGVLVENAMVIVVMEILLMVAVEAVLKMVFMLATQSNDGVIITCAIT